MAESRTAPSFTRATDDAPHQITEIVQKCKQACDSYRAFSDDLKATMKEQDDIFRQHEDLLEQAYGELRVCNVPSMTIVQDKCVPAAQ